MDFVSGFGAAGIIFLIYAGALAFFLPFYVMGIYNQSKKINNNLQAMNHNLQTMSNLLADGLDKGSKSSDQRIC